MAGTRKRLYIVVIFFSVVLCVTRSYVNCVGCISQSNEPIDWFIAYKLPGHQKEVPSNSFFYMDAKSPEWTLSSKVMSDRGQAIYNTLDQIYQTSFKNVSKVSSELLFLMYNDEFPASAPYHRSDEYGHTKGVIAFDRQSGFWLVHSTPKFPPARSRGYNWPSSADIYGQSFLCISMDTSKNIDEIGIQLQYNYPDIYDYYVPEYLGSKYTSMTDAIAGKHVTKEPWYRETELTTLDGVTFNSFAKYSKFDNDLYSDLLATRFRSSLLVETWQNGVKKMCSNCTGKYKVFNVETLLFQKQDVQFKETQDHSKWAVTNSTDSIWTCIGDINRQVSQMMRPGGTVCFQNKSVWKSFHGLINSYHKCGPYRECIPP